MIWLAKILIFRLFFPLFHTHSTIEDIPIKMCIKTFKSFRAISNGLCRERSTN